METLKTLLKGKQGRSNPQGDPTTHMSPVHAHQQQQPAQTYDYAPQPQQYVNSDPNFMAHRIYQPVAGDAVSSADGGAPSRVAQAGNVAAYTAGQNQKTGGGIKSQKITTDDLARIVADEKTKRVKLPRYPGLERWRLIEKMGDGAFSNVYRAVDTEGTAGEVAIKVVRKYEMSQNQGDPHLHADFRKQPNVVEKSNILKEVQIMRTLDHPNIIKLIDFFESRQYYYIILELAPGGELFHQIVRLTYFSENLSRHVITQVAHAIEYLHEEKGVVHRDIKPENLLFSPIPFIPTKNPKPKSLEDEDKADEGEFIKGVGAGGIGRIKIADFGLSKIVWDTQTMTPCGTVGYTAPEIVKDERYSRSVDMWAMGCVLYTLLCGFPPFYDESIQTLTEKVAKGQYTFLSPWWDDISKSAQDLVSHLLTVDPGKRYTIKQFLAHPWIRGTEEPTYAALDAPPLATPAAERQPFGAQDPHAFNAGLVEAPGSRRVMDFRSPGAVNLREVFDVGYAVHRQEEAKRRKYNKTGVAAEFGLVEDDEYNEAVADDVDRVGQGLKKTNLNTAAYAKQTAAPKQEQRGYGQHGPAVVAAARQQVKKPNFELNLESATLLGRRGRKGPSNLRETAIVQ